MKVTYLATILICAVISKAAFGIDQQEHHGQPQHRTNYGANHHQKRTLNERAQIGTRIAPSEYFQIFNNGTSSLIAFYNSTTQTAVIFSFSSSHTLVLNGRSGDAILIDGNHHTLILLRHIWVSSRENFEEFFQSLMTLENISQNEQISNDQALHQLNRLALQLGVSSNALETFLQASKILNDGRAVLIVILHKPEHFPTSRGVLNGVLVLKGLIDLFNQKPEELAKSGVRLNLPSIYEAPNGVVALLRILQTFRNVDLSIIAGNPLNNLENLLKIMVELGGNNSGNGLNNVIHIIYDILLLIRRQPGALDDLIQVLLQTGQDGGVEINGSNITPIIDELLQLAETQNRFNNLKIFRVFIKFLRDLNNNNLFLNDVNISELLLSLQRRDYVGAIDRVVRVFVRINNIVNLTKSVPRFIGYLLSSTRGSTLLPNLLPGVNPDQLQVLRSSNISQLIQNQQNFDNVPIVGQMFNTISSSLRNATNGSQNLSQLLSTNGSGIPFIGGGIPFIGSSNNLVPQFTDWFNGGGGGGGLSWLNPIKTFSGFTSLNPFNGLFNPLQPPGLISPNITNVLLSNCCNSTPTESTESTTPSVVITTLNSVTDDGATESRAKIRRNRGHFKDLKKYRTHAKNHEQERKYYKHEKNHE